MSSLIPIYSLGHSDYRSDTFMDLLIKKEIEVLIDIRRYPNSDIYTYFSKDDLKNDLKLADIKYVWKGEELGGYREEMMEEDPLNDAWDYSGYRAYAGHAFSTEFQDSLETLLDLSDKKQIAIMCAETNYKKCYRRILCDWLLAKEKKVIHIMENKEIEHEFTDFAIIHDDKVVYPKKF